MSSAAERAVRRHMREKATIDKLATGVRKRSEAATGAATQSATTPDGTAVEEQVRKTWDPDKQGGLPTFWRDGD